MNMEKARITLTKMLLNLSDDALEYVWRPIVYAYYYTDQRDPDRLTDDDANRLSLIGAAAHGGEGLVPSTRAGKNFLVNMDELETFLSGGGAARENQ